MSEKVPDRTEPASQQATAIDLRSPFGPLFFLCHLGAFVRDRCPDPAESLPVVWLHLTDGDVLDLCHVIGLAADWAALAVRDAEQDPTARRMRT